MSKKESKAWIVTLINAGFDPQAAVDAVLGDDFARLTYTGDDFDLEVRREDDD